MIYAPKNAFRIALAAALLGAASPLALAQSANVTLENLSKPLGSGVTLTIRRVEATGVNLDKDQLTKLLTGTASGDEAIALGKKLKAERIAIPEVVVSGPDVNVTLRDLRATKIDEGKVESVTLAGAEGKGANAGGNFTFKAGSADIQGITVARLLDALSRGEYLSGRTPVRKMTFAGFEATFPDSSTKPDVPGGNLVRLSMGPFSADSTWQGEIPLVGKGEAKSIVLEPPKNSAMGKQLQEFGYDKLNLGMTFAGGYDIAKKSYAITDFTITGASAGSIGLKFSLGGLEPSFFTATAKAQEAAAIAGLEFQSLSISFANAGLFEKAVAFFAKQQNKTPDAVRAEWSAMTAMAPAMTGGDPAGQKIADAAKKFIASPKSLTVTARAKNGSLKFAEAMGMKNPMALLGLINLDAVAGN